MSRLLDVVGCLALGVAASALLAAIGGAARGTLTMELELRLLLICHWGLIAAVAAFLAARLYDLAALLWPTPRPGHAGGFARIAFARFEKSRRL